MTRLLNYRETEITCKEKRHGVAKIHVGNIVGEERCSRHCWNNIKLFVILLRY